MSTDLPEPWASRLIQRGFTDRRQKDDVPSMGALAEAKALGDDVAGCATLTPDETRDRGRVQAGHQRRDGRD